MVAFTDFLANNYLWFLVASLVLLFALIGYFVDQSEQKKGVSMFQKTRLEEKDLHDLAAAAANKTLNTAVTNAAKPQFEMELPKTNQQNTITDMSTSAQSNDQNPSNTTGFNVLTKYYI